MSTADAPQPARRSSRPIAACAVLSALLPVSGAAQDRPDERGIVPVTPGTQDAAPLRRDMMVQPMDLRLPVGFDRVYRDRSGSEMYYRIGGGVTARFPRSVYYTTPAGTEAGIPPGTVFMIGPPPGSADPFVYTRPTIESWSGGPAVGPPRPDPRTLGRSRVGAGSMALGGRTRPSVALRSRHAHPLLDREQQTGPESDNPIFAGELSRSARIGELLGREPEPGG